MANRSQVIVENLPRLLILGTGWGSYSALRHVKRSLYRVMVASPRNHFLFTPLLASTTVGTLEFRSIIEPVRNTRFRNPDDLHLARAVKLDMAGKTVQFQSVLDATKYYDISYDKLIIGVGALPNTFNVPGVTEYAYFLKEIADARKIRFKILDNFELSLEPRIGAEERQRLLHTVIVGGGPTGVEFGAELYDFIEQDVTRLYGQRSDSEVRVTLVESNKILGTFDKRLQAYAEKKIGERKNFELVKSLVTEVGADYVKLKNGSVIPCGLVVWSTGLGPQAFTTNLEVQKNAAGQIITDTHLRVLNDDTRSCYAIGDCAQIQGMPLPCTAQVAERQGRYVAEALNALAESREVKPFSFRSMGMLTYVGDYKAVSDMQNFKISGITSWLLWRSAYLTNLGSWRLRMQVPLDWLKTLIFGRDTSRF